MHSSASAASAAAATPEQLRTIDAVVTRLRDLPGACLPMLHGIQDALGYVPAEAVDRIAAALNLSRADVHGVVTYYHDFRRQPPGRTVLKLCRAEACQSMGSDRLEQHLRSQHGTALGHAGVGQTRGDGALTAEAVYCLGNCALAPSVLVNGRLHGRVSPSSLDRLLAEAARGEAEGGGGAR